MTGIATFDMIDPELLETDVATLISIHERRDVEPKRQQLIDLIWSKKGFPEHLVPDEIEMQAVVPGYNALPDLASVDRYTIRMEHGVNSIAHLFHPVVSNGQLMIDHGGHDGDVLQDTWIIESFVRNGYSVLAFNMPLVGPNSPPVVELEGIGKLAITTHDHFKWLAAEDFCPIKYFVEPVVAGLNYAQKTHGFEVVHMIGISGGGWTTTLYAAIDQRVKASFPVAGTLPIYLRSRSARDWGDYEQTLPELYRTANYLELYILGSNGNGRQQVQILNKLDPCCYGGVKARIYEDEVRERVASLGPGEFRVFLDEMHQEHNISEAALREVFAVLDGREDTSLLR